MNTIETRVQEYLISKKIYPFSVLYINEIPLLKISFYLPSDLPEFIETSGVGKVCDNSGLRETKDSILLSGVVLSKFLQDVETS